MAYDGRAGIMNRSPVIDSEHRPSPWVQRDHNQTHHRHTSSYHSLPVNNLMDPESEDSDVSSDGDYGSSFSFPINLPPAPSKSSLENQDTIASHLKELERVEAHNVRKHERLKEKRARKDAKIARKRAAQDEKIKMIMDARARRDSRINQRRQRENIAFQRFYEDLDEEETRLQTRLKRLKRGHLVEDANASSAGPSNRRISMNAASPSTPSYSTIPPPAKRHQTSHPTHAEALPPSPYPPPPPPPPTTAHQPSYHFHPAPTHHVSSPYHPGPQYQSPSYGPSPPIASHARVPSGPSEVPPNTTNGQMKSPPVSAPTSMPAPTSTPKAASAPLPPLPPSQTPIASHSIPPRQSNVTYDTRPPPPPPHPSSFAAINHPPSSGFAAINSTHPAPHTPAQTPPIKEEPPRPAPRTAEQTPVRANSAEEKPSAGGSAANKRTPSTTHPYQMSEAFANRHHHCERTDSLNRGIWTFFGLHGSKDHPTVQPVEMYLVCDHDGCRRIDWRTVHGLQCHIVKNHDQPKGTIGSLEKALDRYGVPVREIEEHERQHGPGSGGTMADPKNAKVRTKAKDLLDRRDLSERESSVSATSGFHLQKYPSYGSDSPHLAHVSSNLSGRKRSHSFDEHAPESGSESTPIDVNKFPPVRAVSGFQAVNASWHGVNASPSERPRHREWHPNQAATSNKAPSPHVNQAPPNSGGPTPFWQSWPPKSEIVPDRPMVASNIVPSQRPTPTAVPSIHALNTPTHISSTPTPALSSPPRAGNQTSSFTYPESQPPVAGAKRKELEKKVEVIDVSATTTPEAPLEARTRESKVGIEDVTMTDASQKPSVELQPTAIPSSAVAFKSVEVSRSETPKGDVSRNVDGDERPNNEAESTQHARTDTRADVGADIRPPSRPGMTPEARYDGRPDVRPDMRPDTRVDENVDRGPRTPIREEAPNDREERKETKSPEMSHKRTGPARRESRRSSMAATASAKASMERGGEDDLETNYTANTASKAESVDDDSDSITVNLVPNTDRQRDRDRDADRTKTPIRLPNGRFSRTRRNR